jgi:hypothetical protein
MDMAAQEDRPVKVLGGIDDKSCPKTLKRRFFITSSIAQKMLSTHAIDVALQYLLLNSLQAATSYQRAM